MTPPENEQPDEDGGTFKLKPGAAAPGAGAPTPAPADESGLDRTMKIQRQGGAPAGASTPPPPPSPLGNPTGPAEPNVASFAETTVMPQQGGSQTGFQPASQPPPPNPLGSGPIPQPQAQQPYGQQPQPFPGPPPQQQPGGYPQAPAAPAGDAPDGIKRIGLMVLIAAGVGLLSNIVSIAMNPAGAGFTVIGLLLAAAWGYFGWALPKGKIASSGLRMTGIVLIMIGAGFSILGLFGSFATMAILPAAGAIALIQSIILAGALGYASFIYFKDQAVKDYIKGAPSMAGGYPPAGYPQQPYGQQPPPPPGYGQPQQPQQQPGAYPPPPPGYPQQGQQPPQAPYGG
ncbi:hypothetical protein [Glycomyces sp. NPDC048151]|uniref:hypothetical protein n=1 Tax=Glycomyces sp. NPDC048151 TaxID=3364002 RepID=UPI003719CD3D